MACLYPKPDSYMHGLSVSPTPPSKCLGSQHEEDPQCNHAALNSLTMQNQVFSAADMLVSGQSTSSSFKNNVPRVLSYVL